MEDWAGPQWQDDGSVSLTLGTLRIEASSILKCWIVNIVRTGYDGESPWAPN